MPPSMPWAFATRAQFRFRHLRPLALAEVVAVH
jgi:hypothetical protein